jgi:uncharacterized protein YeaO (DUF488 family)
VGHTPVQAALPTLITVDVHRERYIAEMQAQQEKIAALASRVERDGTVTLPCSRDCVLEQVCHLTLLAGLIEAARRS